MNTVIIDYEMGNVASVQKALNILQIPNIISNKAEDIQAADCILLPGVGSFNKGMENLNRLGLVQLLNEEVQGKKKPFLGICLGMQLIATYGYEPEKCAGLNWIQGEVVKIPDMGKRIPHMGWNNIDIRNYTYFNDIHLSDYYFIHSYHFKANDDKDIVAVVDYGLPIVASVQRENIFATQFHPEKSQQAGLSLLKNFFNSHA